MKLDLQSERYAPTGNISGTGVRKSLGTPSLDPLQILVRESAQNAWDARLAGDSSVTFCVDIRTLSPSEQEAVAELLSVLPHNGPTRDLLNASLSKQSLSVMEISDWGTTGLGGPARADAEPSAGDWPDFVNFFRNVGSPRDRQLGAGTYGYGKSAMYRISRCGTILGYTQAECDGRPVTRFMGASIGDAFEHRHVRYTGRHWWGLKESDAIVDPVVGARAHSVAESVGLAKRGPTKRGTSILILDPDLDNRSSKQAANAVLECIAWFFWPKMMRQSDGVLPMGFDIRVERESVGPVDTRLFPPLEIFVEAMRDAKGLNALSIKCERPIKHLGKLGFAKGPRRQRAVLDVGTDRSLIPEASAVVALMRPAELVVKYLPGPALPSDIVEYAGVFICDEGVEGAFADAEPPAHDDWIPDFLEGWARTFVRVALRRIAAAMDQYATPASLATEPAEQQSLARLGDALGDVLIGQAGSRVGPREVTGGSNGSGSSSGRKRVSVSDPEPFGFALVRKIPCALFRVRISCNTPANVTLHANPFIVLEGGALVSPNGTSEPRVIGWLDETGDTISNTNSVRCTCDSNRALHVAVSVVDDAAITITVADER